MPYYGKTSHPCIFTLEFKVDLEYGVDCTGPCGHRQPDVVVPQVQLERSLTMEEVEHLPEPGGPLSSLIDVCMQTVSLLSGMLQ